MSSKRLSSIDFIWFSVQSYTRSDAYQTNLFALSSEMIAKMFKKNFAQRIEHQMRKQQAQVFTDEHLSMTRFDKTLDEDDKIWTVNFLHNHTWRSLVAKAGFQLSLFIVSLVL